MYSARLLPPHYPHPVLPSCRRLLPPLFLIAGKLLIFTSHRPYEPPPFNTYPPSGTLPYPQLPPLSPYTYSHLVLEARDDASCRGGTVAQARTPRLLVYSALNEFDFDQPPARKPRSSEPRLCCSPCPASRRSPSSFAPPKGMAAADVLPQHSALADNCPWYGQRWLPCYHTDACVWQSPSGGRCDPTLSLGGQITSLVDVELQRSCRWRVVMEASPLKCLSGWAVPEQTHSAAPGESRPGDS